MQICKPFINTNTMFFTITFLIILSVEANMRVYLTDSPIQKIGGRLYKQELLTDSFKDPKELAYDSSTRNLYFMYMDDILQNSGRAFVNVITKNVQKIKGISRNKATAVDPDTGDVYFGSDNGLYRYDPISNEANNIGLYNMNIFKIVIRNNDMFIIDANDHMIYKIFNLGTRAVRVGNMKTVIEFDVDFNGNIHFVTMCGVFCVSNGIGVVKNKDLSVVYHFLSDEYKTFGVTDDGLYEINCRNGTAKKAATMYFFPRSMIFGDYGDIFYSVDDNIYRLHPINSYLVYNVRRNMN